MKRDLEVARAVLLAVEMSTEHDIAASRIVVEGKAPEAVVYNASLLLEERYVRGQVVQYVEDLVPRDVNIERLTWKGHDFLDAARSQDTWDTAMKRAAKVGGSLTFELAKDLLVAVTKEKLGLHGA